MYVEESRPGTLPEAQTVGVGDERIVEPPMEDGEPPSLDPVPLRTNVHDVVG